MQILKSSDYKLYSKFIENLAKKLTRFYYSKLNKPFKVSNKLKNGYDLSKIKGKRFTIEIKKWETKELKPTVKINEVLGEIGEINAEIKNIIIDNKIENIFPKKVLKELTQKRI